MEPTKDNYNQPSREEKTLAAARRFINAVKTHFEQIDQNNDARLSKEEISNFNSKAQTDKSKSIAEFLNREYDY